MSQSERKSARPTCTVKERKIQKNNGVSDVLYDGSVEPLGLAHPPPRGHETTKENEGDYMDNMRSERRIRTSCVIFDM
eukprot:3976144-Amphidinium_carterae.1